MNLAYKYADAFLNVYNSQLNLEGVEHIRKAIQFLQEHPRALFLFQVPSIKDASKQKAIALFCRHFTLIDPIKALITLLLHHKRVYMVTAVLKALVERYQKYHAIEKVFVKSSIPLPAPYRHHIEQFMNRHIAGIKQYHYEIDPRLIAGIRIQTDTMLWEYSMNKRLRDIAHVTS